MITAVMVIVGLGLLIAQRVKDPEFFKRKTEVVDPGLASTVTQKGAPS